MAHSNARQKSSENYKQREKWEKAIQDASALLLKVESSAARLKGAIKTFTELRDLDAEFYGAKSAEEI